MKSNHSFKIIRNSLIVTKFTVSLHLLYFFIIYCILKKSEDRMVVQIGMDRREGVRGEGDLGYYNVLIDAHSV
jgi:hypothetical protein